MEREGGESEGVLSPFPPLVAPRFFFPALYYLNAWNRLVYSNIWTSGTMNDFPVIGDLVMRTGLWDRQGANIASRYKEMYGVELFLRLKPVSLDRECRILP